MEDDHMRFAIFPMIGSRNQLMKPTTNQKNEVECPDSSSYFSLNLIDVLSRYLQDA